MTAQELEPHATDQLGELLFGDPLRFGVGVLDVEAHGQTLAALQLGGNLEEKPGPGFGRNHGCVRDHKPVGPIRNPAIGEVVGIKSPNVGLGASRLLTPVLLGLLGITILCMARLCLAIALVKWSLLITVRHNYLVDPPCA